MPIAHEIARHNLLREQAIRRAHALREQAIQQGWEAALGWARRLPGTTRHLQRRPARLV